MISSLPIPTAQDWVELRMWILTLILCAMLGGVIPPFIVFFGQTAGYCVWIVLWALVASLWMRLPLRRLLRPVLPLVLWMAFYICWGFMAAGYPIFTEAYRLAFRFASITAAVAVVTSSPGRLRVFATAAQWVLVVNLAITLLLMWWPEYQSQPFLSALNVDVESDRFAGMWGNANVAGLVSLLILVLSHWASPIQARIGQACGLAIIYLTESRTATYIAVALALIYLAFAASRKVRLRALVAALVAGVALFAVFEASGKSMAGLISESSSLSRVTDISESKTSGPGGESRLTVLKEWMKMVPQEPWYRYGLYTFYGGESVEVTPRPGFPIVGPHNLYLAILIDAGVVGFLSFLAVILFQLRAIWRAPLTPSARQMMFALCFVLLVFSNFNHNMVTDFPGWIGYPLMFLLATSPALAGERFADGGEP